MAQVKLRFNNVRKEKMLVERRLQVTKKKTASGLSMKTLEGVISYADNEQVDKKVCPCPSVELFQRVAKAEWSIPRRAQ